MCALANDIDGFLPFQFDSFTARIDVILEASEEEPGERLPYMTAYM